MMQHEPLTLAMVRERIEQTSGRRAITEMHSERVTSTSYAALRYHELAWALDRLGAARGARVATLCWNTRQHLELYLAVPCSGRVLHTINVRLSPEEITYILADAEDCVVFVDEDLLPTLADVSFPTSVRHIVIIDESEAPKVELNTDAEVTTYSSLLANSPRGYDWPRLAEDELAGVCYTSGTTGQPKGVTYTHRSSFLHALALTTADGFAIAEHDTCMPVVPMFHANAWGIPYASLIAGSAIALPGRFTDARSLTDLIRTSGVTFAAGVPTVWIALADQLATGGIDLADLASIQRLVVGGSAVSWGLMRQFDECGLTILHAWGMTECSPVGLVARPRFDQSGTKATAARLSQGRPLPGLTFRLVNDVGQVQPWDGESVGELQVSGPWVASDYLQGALAQPDRTQFVDEGGRTWLRTGDVALIDSDGFVQLVDRTKDLIKSGGEWISSVNLENALMTHAAISEAAVIGVPHERWGERPVAYVRSSNPDLTVAELLEHLNRSVARWQLPDSVIFVDEVPTTSVGKFDKKRLRLQHDSSSV